MTRRMSLRVAALLPLGALSTAWTVSLAGVGDPGPGEGLPLPQAASVPSEALDVPASHSSPRRIGLAAGGAGERGVVRAASVAGIPSAALAAYQRAETVINAADKACNIDWQLIAAIGRVESDHGRYGGNVLSTDGVSQPGIYGIALDGTNQTQAISDTDAGQYDRDKVWDRAVGPMQFIPSTWSVVGVDADGDGQRNPQDVDDSALAAAVYLCSGNDDLGTEAGRRAAVLRYNHSRAYVALVLRVREAYLRGDYVTAPDHTTSAVTMAAAPARRREGARAAHGGVRGAGAPVVGETSPDPEPAAPPPSPPGTAEPSSASGSPKPSAPLRDSVRSLEGVVAGTAESVDTAVGTVLTTAEAAVLCTTAGYTALLTPDAWRKCIHRHTH